MRSVRHSILFLFLTAISAICLVLGLGLVQRGYFGWVHSMDYAALQKKPLAKTEAEKRILSIISDMHSPGQVNPLLGKLLRILVEAVHAKKVVEIGTSNGYSALWISLGLQTTNGRLITHEIRPDRAATARSNFKRAGVEDVITVVVGDAHQTIATIEGPIDILFIDAEKPGYADYLDKLFPKIRPGGLILADNANKPSHFPDFIKAITTNPDLETIGLEMQSIGISLSLKKR